MPAIPTSLALTTIADSSSIIAADHRNNYAAIQTAVNGLITLIPGYEYAYSEFTANVSITATTEGTANTVVTASAVTFDGATAVIIEFECNRVDKGTTSTSLYLYEGAASLGILGQGLVAGTTGAPFRRVRRMTPTAGAKTYSIRASVDAGTGTVVANTGGAGANMPGYIRITKA